MRRAILNLVLPAVLLGGVGMAQDPEPENGPGKGVARLSLLGGDVSVKRGDSGDIVAAAVNAPLLADDRLLTGPGARAEIQFDYYHRIRLAQDSEVHLTQLDNQIYQMQVARGTVTFTAIEGGDAQVEVSIPGAAVRPVAYGNYRISVYPDGVADITVRSGEADVFTPSGSEKLQSGQTMRVRLSGANDTEFQFIAELPRDAWDEFNERRDKELRRGDKVYEYVSRDVYGAEDLAGHGDWVYTAPYGYSWRPYVAPDWTPYRYGRWTWADYYGWTWVSYDPWGWAPYHYGRWFNNAGRWCWYPGARVGAHHYWSPALVGWVGWDSWGGFNAGVGFGWGAVGWVPLAPYEPIYRWWGRGWYNGYRGGHNNTTIVNNVNITNIYRNSRVTNGVTVINGNDFRRGEFGRTLRVTNEDFGRANSARGMVPVAPGRENLRLSDREAVVSNISSRTAASTPERFYSRREVPKPDRVPFDDQRRAMERVASRTVGGSVGDGTRNIETLRGGGSNVPRSAEDPRVTEGRGWRSSGDGSAAPSGAAVTPSNSTGSNSSDWRRFGDPGAATRSGSQANRQAATPTDESNRTGWRSFGDPARTNKSAEQPKTAEPARHAPNEGRRTDAAPRSTPTPDTQRSLAPGGGTPRSESPRVERSAPSAPREAPRMDTPRSAPPNAPSTGGGGSQAPKSEPSRSGGRGNDFAGTTSPGVWSTGGGMGVEPRSMPSSNGMIHTPAPAMTLQSSGGFGGGSGFSSGSSPAASSPASSSHASHSGSSGASVSHGSGGSSGGGGSRGGGGRGH